MELTRWQVFLASMHYSAQETGDACTVNCCLSTVSFHRTLCKEYLTAVVTSDRVLNVLMYGSLSFDKIQYVGKRVKWS